MGSLGRLRGVAVAAVGCGLLLLSRAATPLKVAAGLPSSRVLMICVAATLALSIPFAFVRYEKSRRLARHAGFLPVSLCVLVFVAAELNLRDWRSFADRSASPEKPNVVVIFLDTTRHDDSLGPKSAMPQLVRFAERAATFDSAWAPAPWTIPSHMAVLSGVVPWRATPAQSTPMLAERFRSRGYATAAVFSNPLLAGNAFSSGFDEMSVSRSSGVCNSGFGDVLYRVLLNDGPRMPLCAWLTASEVTARSLRFVRRAERPYFLTINYMDTHDPCYVPRECRDAGFRLVPRAEREALLTSRPEAPPTDAASASRIHAQYRKSLSCLDRSLGKLLEAVDRDPSSIVVIVADHGEQFGEHNLGGHRNSVYRQNVHVPLVLRIPGRPPARVPDAVSISDLYQTLLRASDPRRTGASLPLFDSRLRRLALSSYELVPAAGRPKEHAFSLARGDIHLIRWSTGREELYDLRLDPAETRPVAPPHGGYAVGPMREEILERWRQKRGSSEFNALGYLQ